MTHALDFAASTASSAAARSRAADQLEPYEPSAGDPWDFEAAAHLARRVGFGPSVAEVEHVRALGVQAAVDEMLAFGGREEPELDAKLRSQGVLAMTAMAGNDDEPGDPLRDTWMFRIAYTRYPLREKLVLLWHDHFACAKTKVARDPLMRQQNDLFRRLAAGSFRELLNAVARDPAMLVYLDNRLSHKEHPNENWARELLELFTLGPDHYTLVDIQEIARAFTGWTTPAPDMREFKFDAAMHDTGDKHIFGATVRGREGEDGVQEGVEVLDLVLAQPSCGEFIARKMMVWFADNQPDAEVVRELGRRFVASDYSIAQTLRTLLASRYFHARERRFCMVKNPVEFVLGAARALGMQNAHLFDLSDATALMGQDLFEPPSVAGWELGRGWVQSSHVIARCNFALRISELPHTSRQVAGAAAFDVDALHGGARDDAALVDTLARQLLNQPMRSEPRAKLVAYVATLHAAGNDDKALRELRRNKTRALIHLLLSTPEASLV
jgi:hypothetical protein